MKIFEAFDRCGDEDSPFIECGFNDAPTQNTKKQLSICGHLGLSVAEIFSDQWQIKKAEPRILTAEEWIRKKHYIKNNPHPMYKKYDIDDIADAFNAGDKNGQLREWLRTEQVELRNSIKSILLEPDYKILNKLKKLFKDLKPPIMD